MIILFIFSYSPHEVQTQRENQREPGCTLPRLQSSNIGHRQAIHTYSSMLIGTTSSITVLNGFEVCLQTRREVLQVRGHEHSGLERQNANIWGRVAGHMGGGQRIMMWCAYLPDIFLRNLSAQSCRFPLFSYFFQFPDSSRDPSARPLLGSLSKDI